ncbi:MAG: lysozyme [Fusobacteriaceae bacterium]
MELSSLAMENIVIKKKLYLNAYLLEDKTPAIGYGTIRYPDGFMPEYSGNVKLGDKIDQDVAKMLLKYQLQLFEECVNNFIKVPITQNQFDALVTICYNIGIENFVLHPAIILINSFQYREAIGLFRVQYKRDRLYMPTKKEIAQRESEVKLFLS